MAYPMAAVAVLLALVVRPRIARGDFRWLDLALVLYIALVATQLVPLSPAVRFGLSPATRVVDLRLRLDAPADAMADTPHPLTINADATWQTLWLAVAVVLTFWSARAVFARGGLRAAARAIAALGLLLAAFGIAQHATAPHLLYWVYSFKSTTPFGPFLNRSDFAMWLVMALPLTAGYLLARLHSRQHRGGELFTADAFDNTAAFLTVSIGLMAAALMVALSRSGLIGAAAAMLMLWTLSERRMHREGRTWLLGGIGAIALIALAYANTSAVATRIQDTVNQGLGGRLAIWRATMPIIRDFWLTGAGGGAYQQAMLVYQPAPHETYFNHAHNEYLQLISEGGVWLMVPGALALVAAVALMRRRLSSDRTSIYWLRAGAVAGMTGAAVQSLWETGLRRPATTLLFAMLAAIVVHRAADPARRAAVSGETTSADR
jgi:O-antigen ligase